MSEYEGKHDRRLLTRCRELEAANAALERESFALAANQCHGGYAGEYGHHRCRYQDRIAELEQAWERDQSVIEGQRQEIGKLKSKINQSLQTHRALREENKRLRCALGTLIDHCAAWDEAVEKIIGRQPRSGWLDKYKQVLTDREVKDE